MKRITEDNSMTYAQATNLFNNLYGHAGFMGRWWIGSYTYSFCDLCAKHRIEVTK